ncbi:MAG: glucosidase [Chitinophagales bacterium]|nr:glucosidase [Chitinophagales bacterium]
MPRPANPEQKRLKENYSKKRKWLKWGPYLSERQWSTVREDYSANGDAWNFVTHSMSRSKTYRWGEDGIGGISDNSQRLCFAIALWNGKDEILKERLFGLTPSEGNHGEDVKELYYYLDNTPTHSYMKYLYKYPQAAFPYEELIEVNKRRSRNEDEYEIGDTGVFNDGKYFDVFIEYAKESEEDICIKITACNRAGEKAQLVLLPILWFRNQWSFGLINEKPSISLVSLEGSYGELKAAHEKLEEYHFYFQKPERVLFTENETNNLRLYNTPNESPFVKDAFHEAVITNHFELFNEKKSGTKCSPLYRLNIEAHDEVTVKLRLSKEEIEKPFNTDFDLVFIQRKKEADEFYDCLIETKDKDLKNIQRQAYAGMLWNKQFYYIDIPGWLKGDPGFLPPPQQRLTGRNSDWLTLNNEDIISMPDKWEYPWYAAWDLPFHCVSLASLDAEFAKEQLILLLREWYMNPYGQIPAYEWNFSDVNPPVQAWACMQVYKIDKERTGTGDISFLERTFQKLLINFTWWVNRKDRLNNNVFEGGFLGLDNIGVFDRNNVPGGGILEQADGTAWMGMYCLNMLDIALELAQTNKIYEDLATKFFEHFTYIAASINQIREGYKGSWDEEDGFFYDVLRMPDGNFIPLKVRSLVGLTSLFGVHVIDKSLLKKLPDFNRRLKWFVKYRQKNDQYQVIENIDKKDKILLSLAPYKRLKKILCALLDEKEFLSCAGIRSLSKIHENPYTIHIAGSEFGLNYQPGDSNSTLFGGNSNWRGPVWMPMNYLMITALEKYYEYFEDELKVEFPSFSGREMDLKEVAEKLKERLVGIFAKDKDGKRKVNGQIELFDKDQYFKDLILFFECFHGDSGKGIGASHQTGWTGCIAEILRKYKVRNEK